MKTEVDEDGYTSRSQEAMKREEEEKEKERREKEGIYAGDETLEPPARTTGLSTV